MAILTTIFHSEVIMRLTKLIKESFVRAVMNDTPAVDYNTQIREEATKWLKANVPADLQKLAKKHAEYFAVDEYINVGNTTVPFIVLPIDGYCRRGPRSDMARKLNEHVADIVQKQKHQTDTRNELERKLTGTIDAFNTVKQAKDALPELAKYLPEDEATAVKTLPAIANTIADLVAAGWPKGKAAPA